MCLNGQALFDPVFKWYLNDLKINLPNKSYSLDNRLINEKSSHFIESRPASISIYKLIYRAETTRNARPKLTQTFGATIQNTSERGHFRLIGDFPAQRALRALRGITCPRGDPSDLSCDQRRRKKIFDLRGPEKGLGAIRRAQEPLGD